MNLFYSFGIHVYGLLIRTAALFNPKAQLWRDGRKGIIEFIRRELELRRGKQGGKKTIWFHCASLGEFEQGRPLIEAWKKEHPDHFIILTFFSPSGYEHRKNYNVADLVCYMPLDTPANARTFIDLVKPNAVIFVKYEFWFNYLNILQERGIPHYLVSAIFRADQHFFKWYGDWTRNILKGFTHIFVQNENSLELLEFVGITNATVSGDTRFDRVVAIASEKREIPMVQAFCNEKMVLVAGSSWPEDEKLLIRFVSENPGKFKLILVPHEIHDDAIRNLINTSGMKACRYSEGSLEKAGNADILIIDAVGILSQVYRYGQVAYIGGGFGAGIHNILEPAVYGMPVIFGPIYHKFQEAVDLVEAKGAYSIHNYNELERILRKFSDDPGFLSSTSSISKAFVEQRKGATGKILKLIPAI